MYRFLRFCAFSLTGLGVLGLWLSGVVSPVIGVLAVTVVGFSAFRSRWGINVSGRMFLYLLPVALAVLLADWLFFSSPLRWLMHLTMLLVAAKYWSPIFERDLLQIFTISFIHMVAAAAVVQDVAFAFLLVVYTGIVVWGLIAFNCARDVRGSMQEKGIPIDESPVLRGTRFQPVAHLPFVVVTTFSLILLFTLAAFFFVLIPRAGLPATLGGGGLQDMRSGFSDRLELGSIGKIKLEDEVVMRVVLLDGRNGLSMAKNLRWRGVTLDRFDGEKWSRSPLMEMQSESRRVSDDGIMFGPGQVPLSGLLRQQVMLNPIGTGYVFGLFEMVALERRGGPMDRVVYSPVDGVWSLQHPPMERLLYEVHSLPEGSRQESGIFNPPSMAPLGRGFRGAYLDMPQSMKRYLIGVAMDWTRGAQTPRERADRIRRRLRTEYTYTLEVGEGEAQVSLIDFLSRVKKGHCEYYATAMAMLLRAAAIPSRVVTGFLPGEWNPRGNYFIVRQRDAHSWAEAYLPPAGWVTYDATPPDTGSPLLRTGLVPGVQKLIDSMELQWNRHVLSFQTRDQLGILRGIQNVVMQTTRLVTEPLRAVGLGDGRRRGLLEGEILVYLAIGAVILGLAVQAFRRGRGPLRAEWRRRWRRLRLSRTQVGLSRDYLELIRYCEKRTHPKAEAATYLEFARELEGGSQVFTGLHEATELYYRGRFAESGNGRTDRERIRAIARSIRKGRPGGWKKN